jgi:hypothetical protein
MISPGRGHSVVNEVTRAYSKRGIRRWTRLVSGSQAGHP